MSILAKAGVLSRAQDLSAASGGKVSDNVMCIGAAGINAPDDLWLDVETETIPVGAGAITVDLKIDTAASLASGSEVTVVRIYMAAITDPRVAVAGRKVCSINIGPDLRRLAKAMGAAYLYAGMWYVVAGTTWSVNAALSPSKPGDLTAQVIVSTVGVPAAVSAGS